MSPTLDVGCDASSVVRAAEALIEEARRHRRQRRRRWVAVGIAAVLAIGTALVVWGGGGAGSPSTAPDGAPVSGAARGAAADAAVHGRFQGLGLLPVALSGTVRLVAVHGGSTYSTAATDGRWRIEVPVGTYEVRGRSGKVDGGRWTPPTQVTVRAGGVTSGVLLTYPTSD